MGAFSFSGNTKPKVNAWAKSFPNQAYDEQVAQAQPTGTTDPQYAEPGAKPNNSGQITYAATAPTEAVYDEAPSALKKNGKAGANGGQVEYTDLSFIEGRSGKGSAPVKGANDESVVYSVPIPKPAQPETHYAAMDLPKNAAPPTKPASEEVVYSVVKTEANV